MLTPVGSGTASSVKLRWLFIVNAGETALYQRLATRLAGEALTVLDRRRGDRRRARASVASDRRRGDRRRPLAGGGYPCPGLEYCLVYHSERVDVYGVESPSGRAVCPECTGLEMLERLAGLARDDDEVAMLLMP